MGVHRLKRRAGAGRQTRKLGKNDVGSSDLTSGKAVPEAEPLDKNRLLVALEPETFDFPVDSRALTGKSDK
jgi:hypothetical protein